MNNEINNRLQDSGCCGGVHAKVFEILLIIGFITSFILLTVSFVLTMWFFKYSTYIFAIEICLIGLNFFAIILAIILRVWRSNGTVNNINNSSSFLISILILVILIISLLGSIANDLLTSYLLEFRYMYFLYFLFNDEEDENNRRILEELGSSSSYNENSSGEIISNSLESGLSSESISIQDSKTVYITELSSENGQVLQIPSESICEDCPGKNSHGENEYPEYPKSLEYLENLFGITKMPDENLIKIFQKIFNKYNDYLENIEVDEDLEIMDFIDKQGKKENFAKLFSYISNSYNAFIQIFCLIILIFIIKRIKSRSDYGSGIPSQIGVSSFQNMLRNNRNSKLVKGNIYNDQETNGLSKKKSKKKKSKKENSNQGSDKIRIISKKKNKKRSSSRKKKH